MTSLVQIMAQRRIGDNHYLDQWWSSLLMHICITRPQWFNIKTFFSGFGICIIRRSSYFCKDNSDTGKLMALYFKHCRVFGNLKNLYSYSFHARRWFVWQMRYYCIVMMCFNHVQTCSYHTLGQCIKGDTDGICFSNIVRLFFWSHSNMVYLTVTWQYFKYNVIIITDI